MAETVNTREIVMNILLEVTRDGQDLNQVTADWLAKYQYIDARDRHFISRLAKATYENMIMIDWVLNHHSNVKVNKMKPVIRTILRMGVCQLLFMDGVPAHAICNESVKLALRKNFKGLKGFVNGVLRNVARHKDEVDQLMPSKVDAPITYLSVRYSMPEWLCRMWNDMYGFELTEGMMQAMVLETAGTSLRVNTCHLSPEKLCEKLTEAKITVKPHPYLSEVLRITDYDYLPEVPGFETGDFWVQDASSVLAGLCADFKPGMTVLDLCGAPGGKSLNAAAIMGNDGQIICRDVSMRKIERIQENVARTQLTMISPELHDALILDETLVGKADVVIADVPCSGLGVIGKKTDIKYHMTPEGLASLTELQRGILDVAWRYLKPGGILMYSTCTINIEENQQQVQWLTQNYPLETESLNAYLPEVLQNEETAGGMLQLMPGIHDCDGFFVARLRKKS